MGRRERLKTLTRSWAGRTLDTGRVAATLGKSAVKTAMGKPDDGAVGAELLGQLDRMKGLALKVGQMASYLEGALPPESAKALEKLQQNVEPMEWEAVQAVVETSLGAPLDELFDAFEHEPVAAASIGQVHKAVLDGRPVAVKVQYPGVRDTLSVDLGNLSKLGALARFGFSDAVDVVQELRERFEAECDYLAEADHTELAGRLLADEPGVHVPAVHRERCSDVVLCTEWIEGHTFQEFLDDSTQAERNAAGHVLFRTAFRMLFGHGVFNADPHPGNVLFTDAGVVLLDWGCVVQYDAAFIDRWKVLAKLTLEGRREDLPAAVVGCGFAEPGSRFDYDAHWDVMLYLYRPFLTSNFTYSSDYVRESWQLMMADNPNLRHMKMPREWTFANRLQWGLNSVLAALEAEGDWGTLFTEAVHLPTRCQVP